MKINWNGIRKFIIRALGGYDELPPPEIKYLIRDRLEPMVLEGTLIITPYELIEGDGWAKEQLAQQIADKMVEEGIISFSQSSTEFGEKIKARATVVKPI